MLSITQLVLTFVLAGVHAQARPELRQERVYICSSLLTVIGGAIVFFTPAEPGLARIHRPGAQPRGRRSLVNMLVWALEADTVEYGEWKTGVRTEGITYALFSFTRKTGQAVGGALAAYALALGGYKSGAVADRRRRVRHPARRRRPPGRADHPGRARDVQIHAHGCHARREILAEIRARRARRRHRDFRRRSVAQHGRLPAPPTPAAAAAAAGAPAQLTTPPQTTIERDQL